MHVPATVVEAPGAPVIARRDTPPARHARPALAPWGQARDGQEATRALAALSRAMRDPAPHDRAGDNPDLPAGYTYLLRFVHHDLTFVARGPDGGGRGAARLSLDGVYGLGPESQPYLYERHDRAVLRIGHTSAARGVGDPSIQPGQAQDLLRLGTDGGDAVIPDRRNDAHLLTAQLHLAFQQVHNAVQARLGDRYLTDLERFEAGRTVVTWHYQWLVLHDLLPRLLDAAVHDGLLAALRMPARRGATSADGLGAAAALAGFPVVYSMMRQHYDINAAFNSDRSMPSSLQLLFEMTGERGNSAPIPGDWAVDWNRFFPAAGRTVTNASRQLDPACAPAVHEVPSEGSWPYLQLLAGRRAGLPSGQALAAYLRVPAVPRDALAAGTDGAAARQHGLLDDTPLWYYVLKEAEQLGGTDAAGRRRPGRRLGPLGSRLLADAVRHALAGDAGAYVNVVPHWLPELGGDPGRFTMAELLACRHAGDGLTVRPEGTVP